MTDNRRPVGAAVPRPRPSGGVMGYVAELQQLDTTPTPSRSDLGGPSAPYAPADRTPADPVTVEFTVVGAAVPRVPPASAEPAPTAPTIAPMPATPVTTATDPAVASFEGGLVATATATDDATAEFLLGWVHDTPRTTPAQSPRGRRGALRNRRPRPAVPAAAPPAVEQSRRAGAPMRPSPAAARTVPITAPTLVHRSPSAVAHRAPAALMPAPSADHGSPLPAAALVRPSQVPVPALMPRPVRLRPLRTAVALDRLIAHPAYAAGGDGGVVDLGAVHAHGAVPGRRVAGRRRRLRPTVLSLAAVAVAIAAGVAYGAHSPAPTTTVVLPPPRLQVPTPGTGYPTGAVPGIQPIPPGAPGAGSSSAGGTLPGTVTLPGPARSGSGGPGLGPPGSGDPGSAGPGSGSPGTGGPGSGSPGTGGPGSGGPGSSGPDPGGPVPNGPGSQNPNPGGPGTTDPGWPGPPTEPVATRTTQTSLPTRPAPVPPAPPPVPPAPPSVPAVPLRASFSRTADVGPLGLTGYVGTVRITNPGGADVTGWRVRITVPGGNEVPGADGAKVEQNGNRVVFTPTAATRTVPAGYSVTFSFTVRGVLTGEPTGCSIDDRPCY